MEPITIEEIFSEENIAEALSALSKKRDTCGIDGIMLSDLPDYWKINRRSIIEELSCGTYQPKIVRETEIVNYKGKKRQISIISSIDRLLLRCLSQVLQQRLDCILDPCCFGFRSNLGVAAAVEKAAGYLNDGLTWIAKIDIRDYFDRIPIRILEKMLSEYVTDDHVMKLMDSYLHPLIEKDGEIHRKTRGILQGSPLSPFLSNLYLTPFDKSLSNEGIHFCRFGDDIAAFFSTAGKAGYFIKEKRKTLQTEYHLPLNEKKTDVFDGTTAVYLGYEFQRDEKQNRFTAVRKKQKTKIVQSDWNREVIRKTDRNYHLISDGILSRRDYNLLFENEDGKKHIPAETSRTLNIYSNVIFSAGFFRFISSCDINVNIFDKYGRLCGTFSSAHGDHRAGVMLKQAEFYLDEGKRTGLARKLEIASLHNIRTNLKYYSNRRHSEVLRNTAERFSNFIREINEANDITEMMTIEARARQLYYAAFNEIIRNDDFTFSQRTKRPPKDSLNAMISFGNTWLYNRIAAEINKTSLDIRIGCVHSTNRRSQSLNLDIADLFKPVIIDRTIFTLINKRIIDAKKHFREPDGGGVYLNDYGKRLFLSALDEKIKSKYTVNNLPVSYDSQIRKEIRSYKNHILKGASYKPYKYS